MEATEDELREALFAAMAKMGIPNGLDPSVYPIGSLLDKRPDLARRLAGLDPVLAATTFAGLLTVPEFQASAFRLEALVHLSLAVADGNRAPTDDVAAALFRYLGEGICGRMEDPAEDVFVGAIRSPWGNFRVLEGIWEGATFYLQRFVEVVASMPDGAPFDDICRSILALLRLSDAVCDRADLERWQLGEELPAKRLPKRGASALLDLQRRVRFSKPELKAIGIEPGELVPFVYDLSRRGALWHAPICGVDLERRPVVAHGGAFHLILPTAVTTAIRHFVVEAATRYGLLDSLRQAITRSYVELLSNTPLLGGTLGAPLSYAWREDDAVAEMAWEFEEGRHIHFVFFDDPLTGLRDGGFSGINPASATIGAEIDRRITRTGEAMSRREGYKSGLTIAVACGIGRGIAFSFDRQPVPNWRYEFCSAYDLVTLSWTQDFTPATLWRYLDARDRVASLGVTLYNFNGLINLVAWARGLDGHIVPHAQLPDDFAGTERATMLMIDQNRLRNLRHEVWSAYDPRAARFVDGEWVEIRKDSPPLFTCEHELPLYASDGAMGGGGPLAACLAPRRTWWAAIECPPGAEGRIACEYWRLVATWLVRVAPALDGFPGLPDGPLCWRAVFENTGEVGEPPEPRSSYDDARAAIRVTIDRDLHTIIVVVSDGFQRAQYHPQMPARRGCDGVAARPDAPDG